MLLEDVSPHVAQAGGIEIKTHRPLKAVSHHDAAFPIFNP